MVFIKIKKVLTPIFYNHNLDYYQVMHLYDRRLGGLEIRIKEHRARAYFLTFKIKLFQFITLKK